MIDFLKKSSNQANWDLKILSQKKVISSEGELFKRPSLEDLPSKLIERTPKYRDHILQELQKESLYHKPNELTAVLKVLLSKGNPEKKAGLIKALLDNFLKNI